MAASTVRVKGLKETQRAFRRLGSEVGPEIKAGLKDAAEPVASEARQRIGRYPGASTSTIKPYASSKGVVVRQSARKRGGRHPQFGSLQMGHLLGALDDRAPDVERKLEEVLDHLTRREGF